MSESAAIAPLRTPEQMEWIRDRFKPDGLRRLARSTADYYEQKGSYLPDVAALAYAEWERAERLVSLLDQAVEALDIATDALAAGTKMPDRAVLTAKLATATNELRVAVGEVIGGDDEAS